jgi:hypothetical protein
MLIETHAHLDYSDFVPGSPKVLERAADTDHVHHHDRHLDRKQWTRGKRAVS